MPPGDVTIMLRRVPDEYAAIAKGEVVFVAQAGKYEVGRPLWPPG
jgi:hypothetical protein